MIELRKKDIIEFEIKMQNFRKAMEDEDEKDLPHCPTCNSINLKRFSTKSKVLDTVVWGIFGTKRHKTYHCNNCGYEW